MVERAGGRAVAKAVLLFLVLFVTWQILFLLGPQSLNTELFSYLIIAAALGVFLIIDRQTLSGLGFRRTKQWRTYIVLALVLVAVFVSYLLILSFLLFANTSEASPPVISTVGYGPLSIPYVVALALVVGVVEEVSFRGYILRNFNRSYSVRNAIVFSSVFFALYHLSIPGILSSTTAPSQTFTFWTSFLLFVFSGALLAGYFYDFSQQTVSGIIAFHSGNILLQSFTPYTSSLTNTVGYLLDSIPILLFIPLLSYLRRKMRGT